MTTFSDETLMAFADDELDPVTRAAVNAAMHDDPEIERRIARHRALRLRVRLAYDTELHAAPPERLVATVRRLRTEPQPALDPAQARAAVPRQPVSRSRWRSWMSLAASLLIGVTVGYFALHRTDSLMAESDGGWVARGRLARALSGQLGSEGTDAAALRIGLSFLAKTGAYCRLFTLPGAASVSGMACRERDEWQIRVLAQGTESARGEESQTRYRTAGTDLSPVILDAAQQQMAGEPLDRDGETQARQRNWQPAPR